jgi:hypothetical protein
MEGPMHIQCQTKDAEQYVMTVLGQHQLSEGNGFFKASSHINDSSITITISRPLSQRAFDVIREELRHAPGITIEEAAA